MFEITNPLTNEYVKSFIEVESNSKYRLLTKYVNSKTKIKILCDKGHEWETLFDNFRKGHRCGVCNGKGKWNRITVAEFILKEGYIPLVEYTNYLNDMKLQCPEGHIYKCNFKRFKRGDRCPHCAGVARVDGNEAIVRFKERGFIPQFKPEEYKNSHQRLYFLCPKHAELGLQTCNLNNLKNQKYVCSQCYLEANSGENHYLWKGGVSKIYSYLRNHITEWKLESMLFCDNMCDITGDNSQLEVHHLHKSFSEIMDEVFEETHIEYKSEISDYSKDELSILIETCKELHSKYGLGVVLTRDLHFEFHKRYGRHNNTPEQYYEFKLFITGERRDDK